MPDENGRVDGISRRHKVAVMAGLEPVHLNNTDLRWYRDKYLAIISATSFVGAAVHLARWPAPHDELGRGLTFLAIAALCLVISPQRLPILSGALAIIVLRGIIGSVLYRSLPALLVAMIAGAAFYTLAAIAAKKGRVPYKINEYSYPELAIDTCVLLSLLWIYLRIA